MEQDWQGESGFRQPGCQEAEGSWSDIIMAVGFSNGVEPATPAEIAREVADLSIREERAQLLRERFEEWDREDREQRMNEFLHTVGGHWEAAVSELEQDSWTVVRVSRLGADITTEMLIGTFEQIDLVLSAELGGEGEAFVRFADAEAAAEAAVRFNSVSLAGRPMACEVVEADSYEY